MSVLIKGMEMPQSCSVCPMLEGDRMDGLCHAASKWLDDDEHWTWHVYPEGDTDDSKPCNCPLIPVPPHGRLIDADELRVFYEKWHDDEQLGVDIDKCCVPVPVVRLNIDDAPTIIEAEGDE